MARATSSLEAVLSEHLWTVRWSPSIFSKLLAIMLAMTVVLLIMVTSFFALLVFPATFFTPEQTAQEYAHVLASGHPDRELAKSIRERAGIDIRYEGPDDSWTTSESLPTREQIRSGKAHSSPGRRYLLEAAPGGATYLLAWDARSQIHTTHIKLLWMLLLLILAVVLVTYWFQKRLLRPVHSLSEGVARLSHGQLDIVLPVFTHDELGLLTSAFNRMVREVKEMMKAKDQLLLDVSHELRSPLTRVKVALALLPEDENKAGLASDIEEMETMISELLELERLRTPGGISRQKQDLVPILQETVHTFENRPPGILLVAHSQSIIASLDGDKIRVVLRNLLENAFKYSFPESRPVDMSIREDQRNIVIRVQDDGCGIPPEDLTNIFEPFFRIDPSRSKKTGGYGLGLSICKRIVEAHGGTVEVANNPGRGVVFTVTIPRMV